MRNKISIIKAPFSLGGPNSEAKERPDDLLKS